MTSEQQAREKINAPLAAGGTVTNTASICIRTLCPPAIRKPSLGNAHRIRPTRRHRGLVMINESLNVNACFATLAHALGHIYCGHLGAHPEGFW